MNFIKWLVLSCLLLSQTVNAETCPSVAAIKNSALKAWQAYDSDDGKPLSSERQKAFKAQIEQFALAEWVDDNKQQGIIHCYYRDAAGSTLEAYLSKKHFIPANNQHYWYKVSGFMQCAAGMNNCAFVAQTHLAKK